MSRRVAISGTGTITALGMDLNDLWSAMTQGRSGIAWITRFDPAGYECRAAGQLPADMINIRKLVPKSYRKATKVMCPDIELAVAAADAAIRSAGLTTHGTDPDVEPTIAADRFGCQIGAGLIAVDVEELAPAITASSDGEGSVDLATWGPVGIEKVTPLWMLKYLPNMLACHVTIVHNLQGPSNAITGCESSSGLSLGESLRIIRRGDADACLSGGAETRLNLLSLCRQDSVGRLAATEGVEDPTTILKPFDPAATGTLIGEAGGILVTEAIDSIEARGGTPLAELLGFACTQSCDVGPLAASSDSISDAISAALDRADTSPDDIDLIIGQGLSIPAIDDEEAAAYIDVFGAREDQPPLVSITPFTGNCGAAHGAIQLAVATRCLQENMIPARLNAATTGAVNGEAASATSASVSSVLVVSVGQGGQNTATILGEIS
jgi:3-oxoacyl-[acyl-carrier-protein] synthase II